MKKEASDEIKGIGKKRDREKMRLMRRTGSDEEKWYDKRIEEKKNEK